MTNSKGRFPAPSLITRELRSLRRATTASLASKTSLTMKASLALTTALSATAPLACQSTPPAQQANDSNAGFEYQFDPTREADTPPVDVPTGIRGPGLILDGMRIHSKQGAFMMAIGAFDDAHDIVFTLFPDVDTPTPWWSECRNDDDELTPFNAAVVGVEAKSWDANTTRGRDEDMAQISIDAYKYLRLKELSLDICGQRFVLPERHQKRVAEHQRMVAQRVAASDEQLESKCNDGNANSCFARGEHVDDRLDGSTEDVTEAARWFEKGCNADHAASCLYLSGFIFDGKIEQSEPGQGLALGEKACTLGNVPTCTWTAYNCVAQSESCAETQEASFERAASLAERACNTEKPHQLGCLLAARLSLLGQGTKPDAKKASQFIQKACNNTQRGVCQAAPVIEACANDDAASCLRLSEAPYDESRPGHKDGLAQLWLKHACETGLDDSRCKAD